MAPQSASRLASQDPTTYFRSVRPFWMVLITAGLAYYSWAIFAPSTIPCDVLGPLGRFTKYLLESHKRAFQVGYLVSWAAHIGEAFLSLWLCKKKGIKDSKIQHWWFIQTLLFGIASTYYLLSYKPQKKRH